MHELVRQRELEMTTRRAVFHAQLFIAINANILRISSKTYLCSDVKFYLITFSVYLYM